MPPPTELSLGFQETWFKTIRSQAARKLRRSSHSAYALLAEIADRAWWKDTVSNQGLTQGQALIGAYKDYGFKTEKQYRVAKALLAREGLAKFEGKPRLGTIATLLKTSVFDPNFQGGLTPKMGQNTPRNGADSTADSRPSCPPTPTHATTSDYDAPGNHRPRSPGGLNGGLTPQTRRNDPPNGAINNKDKKEKKETSYRAQRGERKTDPAFDSWIHEFAGSWSECWRSDMHGIREDFSWKRDRIALCELAKLRLPVTGVLGIARYGWSEHRKALAAGRADYEAKLSLKPVGFLSAFTVLQSRMAAGYSVGNAHKALAQGRANMEVFLARQRTARRIELEHNWERQKSRLRYLSDPLEANEANAPERNDLKAQIAEIERQLTALSANGEESE